MAKRFAMLVVLVACGKGAKVADWTRTPLTTIDATAGGVTYQITLPEDWVRRTPPDEGWEPPTGDPFKRPHANVQNVSADFASSLESAISAAGAKPETLTRKETKPDGFALTEVHGQTLIRATVFKKVGGSVLWCTADQANDDGLVAFDATKTALVKICDSVTPK